MANNDKEVTLTLKAQTEGAAGIKAMADEIRQVAKEGGDAAAPLKAIAQELDALAAQQTVITNFQRVSEELTQTAAASRKAATEVDNLTTQYNESKAALDAATTAERESAAVVKSKTEAYRLAQAAYKESNAALTAAKAAVADLNAATLQEQERIDNARKAVLDKRAAMQQSNAELAVAKNAYTGLKEALDQANASFKESNGQYSRAKGEADALATSERQLTQAFDAAESALRASGISTQDLGRKQAEAATEIERLSRRAAELPTYLREMAQAFDTVATKEREAANAARAEQEEHDRLAAIVEATNARIRRSSEETLAAEKANYAESEAFVRRHYEEVAAIAKAGATRVNAAMDAIGFRSSATIQAEILKINNALGTLAREAQVSGKDFDAAMAQGKARITELEKELSRAGDTSTTFGSKLMSALSQFGPVALVINGVQYAIQAVINTATKIPEVAFAFDSLNRALRVVFGTSKDAAEQMEFIRTVANRSGTDINELGKSYVSLSAATKGTALEGAKTRAVFEAVTMAMGSLGKSSAETGRAMQAVAQMASKGVVSMEELRQQLGEALPGAMKAMADGLGVTVSELTDFVSAGKLAATDALPALERGIYKVYDISKANDSMQANWTRYTNAIKEYGSAIGNVVLPPLMSTVKWISVLTASAAELLQLGGNFFYQLGSWLTTSKKTWGDFVGSLSEALDSMRKRVQGLAGTTDAAQAALYKAALAAKDAGKEFFYTAEGVRMSTSAVLDSANSLVKQQIALQQSEKDSEKLAVSARKVAEATRAAGEASVQSANALGTEIEKRDALAKAAANNAAELAKVVVQDTISLNVKKEQLRVAELQLKIAGDEDEGKKKIVKDEVENRQKVVDGLNKEVEAHRLLALSQKIASELAKDNSEKVGGLTKAYVEAIDKLMYWQTLEVDEVAKAAEVKKAKEEVRRATLLLNDAEQDQINVLKSYVSMSGDTVAAKELEIIAVEKQIEAARRLGEVDSDRIAQLEVMADKLNLERQVMEDNSKRTAEFAYAKRMATQEINNLREAQAKGIDVTEQMTDETKKLALATALLKDAYADEQKAVSSNLKVKQAKNNLAQEEIKLAISQLQSYAEISRASGNEKDAVYALNEVKQLEIQLAGLAAEAKMAEAEAELELVAIKRKALDLADPEYKAKMKEIEAEELNAKAKMKSAEIAQVVADKMAALANGTNAAGDSFRVTALNADSAANSVDKVGSSAESTTEKMVTLAAGVRKVGEAFVNAQGWVSDAQGNALQFGGETRLSIAEKLKSYGVAADAALDIAGEFADSNGNVNNRVMSAGQRRYGGTNSTLSYAIQKAAEKWIYDNRGGTGSASTSAPTSTQTSTGTVQGSSVVVNISGISSTTVNTASQTDSNNLVALLQNLANASTRATI